MQPNGLDVTAVWAPECLRHEPDAEIWVGLRTVGTEVPERATVIHTALAAAGARIVPATAHADDAVAAVHDPAFLAHLSTVYSAWEEAGFPSDWGQDRVVPYVFPTAAMLGPLSGRVPAAIHGRAGLYAYDTMTLVGPGTWAAARAAVDAALTAVDVVLGGAAVAYANCRPPGHHATRAGYGGSCYLNNAAVAAQALIDAGSGRVAILDIDAHHGNGTQAIFYDRADVSYGSAHVDPGAGWFPHYVGFADERGAGANLNIPLPPGAGDPLWLAAIADLCSAAGERHPDAVVVSLGVDAAVDDPESPLAVSRDGYRRTGALIRELGVPIVAVQEGGYHLPTLGALTVATLTGLSAG